jgi:cytochrome oxidase Cu insertion factor (SCO1/SenC/PrrC family)
MPSPQSSRRVLWLLLLAFAMPLALSFLAYYGLGWAPAGHINHGRLIVPPRTLPQQALPRANASAGDAPTDLLRGKWSLLYAGSGACEADCRATLYFMRQTHLSLGSLMSRVQRVFLATERSRESAALARDYPDLVAVDASDPAAAAVRAAFPQADRPHGVFIVDPLGNVMMRYDAQQDPKGLRDDLKKLLGLSHIG